MSTYEGAWRPEEPKETIPAWDFAAYRKSSPEGPWGGVEDLFPEGKSQLPRSASGFLKAAQEHGWGFGPISLVMRLNRADAKPLYVSWLYSVTSSAWSFDGAGVKGHHLKQARDALALVRTEPLPEPKAPDYERYSLHGGAGWCEECGTPLLADDENFPELLQAVNDHERENHVE